MITMTMKENPVSLSEYAKSQLEKANLMSEDTEQGGFIGVSVLELAEVFERQGHADGTDVRVADLFCRLVRGEAIVAEEPEGRHGFWETILLGTNVRLGDAVRVKKSAYSVGRLAELHNGKLGVLVGTRNGLCTVRYTDGQEFQHEAALCEVLVER